VNDHEYRKESATRMRAPLVLVVDDDDDCRDVVSLLLRSHGFQVWTAGNGREALELLRQVPTPLVIVLDLMMPVMDGFEMLAIMRHDPSLATIPVVVVSASHDPRARDIGATRVLQKPFCLEVLVEAVQMASRSKAPPQMQTA
jgi:CheY-like chemotaxis protein